MAAVAQEVAAVSRSCGFEAGTLPRKSQLLKAGALSPVVHTCQEPGGAGAPLTAPSSLQWLSRKTKGPI